MDIRIEDHGSIVLVTPVTEAGRSWVAENLTGAEMQMWGRDSVVVEPRYVGDIITGAQDDGLEVTP